MTTILVTGGSGFIGCNLIKKIIDQTDYRVVNIDREDFPGKQESKEVIYNPRYIHYKIDICNTSEVETTFKQTKPEMIFHLAAESHVDRSITGPGKFIDSNIFGTYSMITIANKYYKETRGKNFRFLHISTDEVYGSLKTIEDQFTEKSRIKPNSPYAATKASSDLLVRAWNRTYGFPAIISNCSNNYGPFQHPEKFIPKSITNLMEGEDIPIYGRGTNIRDWIYVDDHCDALWLLMEKGEIGETYAIGGDCEITNIDLAKKIGVQVHHLTGKHKEKWLRYVSDRPGHDFRYAIDCTKMKSLGWEPKIDFDLGLEKTILWYAKNKQWWKNL